VKIISVFMTLGHSRAILGRSNA